MLIEALVLNVPIVSTACPTGAREIVSVFDEKYLVDLEVGTLEEDIANHIASILEKKPVVNCDIERFSSFSAMKKWNQLLQDTLKVSCL